MSRVHEVQFWGALRPFAGGHHSVLVDADTIREMFRVLSSQYPAMARQIEQGIAVSINGKIYRDQWDVELPPGAEIYLMPRLAGG